MSMARRAVRLLLASVTAVLLVAVVSGQEAVAPSEKNMFVGTPAGWKHPTTAWGDPDIQGTWPISFVGGVPLERCAPPFGARGSSSQQAPCDQRKAFYTEDEFKARTDATKARGDRYATAIKSGDL